MDIQDLFTSGIKPPINSDAPPSRQGAQFNIDELVSRLLEPPRGALFESILSANNLSESASRVKSSVASSVQAYEPSSSN